MSHQYITDFHSCCSLWSILHSYLSLLCYFLCKDNSPITISILTVNEHIRTPLFIFFPLHVNERHQQMNGLIEAQTVFWPEESSQILHIPMANFNLCVHSSTIYFSFWMQSMVCRKHWSRTREYLWGEGWRKESFKPGMTNRWGCLRMPCLLKFVFGLVAYWAFWNKSTPFCVIRLHKTILKLLSWV